MCLNMLDGTQHICTHINTYTCVYIHICIYGANKFKCPHQNTFYTSDLESTLNASKLSTFRVSNKFWESEMAKIWVK